MPDIAATRPTSGTPIETAWGDQVHDAIEGIQAGKIAISLAASAVGSATVTFPRAYATPPVVLASCASTNLTYFTNVGAVTTTTAVLTMTTKGGTNATDTRDTYWVAIGTPA